MVLKKYCLPGLFVLILGMTAISCASTPPETETQIETQTEAIPEEKAISEVSTLPEETPEPDIYLERIPEAKTNAESSKTAADTARAFKGDPENYKAAENLLAQAMTSEEKMDYKTAVEAYYQADETYKLSIIRTEENKQAALEAMRAMENAITNTEKKAEDAAREAVEEDER